MLINTSIYNQRLMFLEMTLQICIEKQKICPTSKYTYFLLTELLLDNCLMLKSRIVSLSITPHSISNQNSFKITWDRKHVNTCRAFMLIDLLWCVCSLLMKTVPLSSKKGTMGWFWQMLLFFMVTCHSTNFEKKMTIGWFHLKKIIVWN